MLRRELVDRVREIMSLHRFIDEELLAGVVDSSDYISGLESTCLGVLTHLFTTNQ